MKSSTVVYQYIPIVSRELHWFILCEDLVHKAQTCGRKLVPPRAYSYRTSNKSHKSLSDFYDSYVYVMSARSGPKWVQWQMQHFVDISKDDIRLLPHNSLLQDCENSNEQGEQKPCIPGEVLISLSNEIIITYRVQIHAPNLAQSWFW